MNLRRTPKTTPEERAAGRRKFGRADDLKASARQAEEWEEKDRKRSVGRVWSGWIGPDNNNH